MEFIEAGSAITTRSYLVTIRDPDKKDNTNVRHERMPDRRLARLLEKDFSKDDCHIKVNLKTSAGRRAPITINVFVLNDYLGAVAGPVMKHLDEINRAC
jgi:hypothetical protein